MIIALDLLVFIFPSTSIFYNGFNCYLLLFLPPFLFFFFLFISVFFCSCFFPFFFIFASALSLREMALSFFLLFHLLHKVFFFFFFFWLNNCRYFSDRQVLIRFFRTNILSLSCIRVISGKLCGILDLSRTHLDTPIVKLVVAALIDTKFDDG